MRARFAGLVAALVLILTAGCVGLPDAGPVTVPGDGPEEVGSAGVDYVPPGPVDGESPAEIVQHFLGAMRATSYQTRVARLFLTAEAADAWSPESRTIVYDEVGRPESGSRVTVDLTGAAEIDAEGRWQGAASSGTRQISFGLVQEDGEWRIASLPDALIVPLSWFEARHDHVDLYFLDPSSRILIPTPVYLAGGDQLPTRLVSALLRGPGPDLAGVATTALGATTSPGLTVEVSGTGVATVRLTSGAEEPAPQLLSEPMVAQLAWTLRQLPSIARVQVRVDDVPVPTPDGEDTFSVTAGQRYAPDVVGADPALYGLSGSTVVDVTAGGIPVQGAEALAQAQVESLSMSVTGRRAAGQPAGGGLSIVALDDPEAPPTTVPALGAAQVAWDFADRMWVLDGGAEARVRVVTQGSAEVIDVPGVSGQEVRRLLVSRDGSRLVALVGPVGSQRVVAARVRYDERGGVVDVAPQPTQLAVPLAGGEVVLDVAWRSPTDVVVLSRLEGGLAQIQTAAIDGSDAGRTAADVLITSAGSLVTSPVAGSQLLIAGPEGVEEFEGGRATAFGDAAGITSLTYAG